MASKKSAAKASINLPLLSMIAAATAAGGFHYVTKDEASPLLSHVPQLIEVNTNMIEEGTGKAAARATSAGTAMTQTAQSGAAVPGVVMPSPFGIIKGAILPPSRRGEGLRGGGAPKQYPFDTMEVGDSFFVPVSEKHPDPLKTLGSTVSSANMRFAEETGEMRKVHRKVRGKDRKATVDGAGNFVYEDVEIPVYKHTRKFEIRGIEGGKQYGQYVAPANGALISRTA
jgi:hypothetical protein